jgi:hypothetical protein
VCHPSLIPESPRELDNDLALQCRVASGSPWHRTALRTLGAGNGCFDAWSVRGRPLFLTCLVNKLLLRRMMGIGTQSQAVSLNLWDRLSTPLATLSKRSRSLVPTGRRCTVSLQFLRLHASSPWCMRRLSAIHMHFTCMPQLLQEGSEENHDKEAEILCTS